ncbi:MAG: hypothetical protein RLY86_1609 [Pseudomonadota bacterium]|jgi:AraC-like DNA-binding protein
MAVDQVLVPGLLTAGAAQAFFLAVLLVGARQRRTPAAVWLALALAAFGLNLTGDLLEVAGAMDALPALLLVQVVPLAVIGPAMRLHVAALLAGPPTASPLTAPPLTASPPTVPPAAILRAGQGTRRRHLAVPVVVVLLLLPWALVPGAGTDPAVVGDGDPNALSVVAVVGVFGALLLTLGHQAACLAGATRDLARARGGAADGRLAWVELLLRVLLTLWLLYALTLVTGMVPGLEGVAGVVGHGATLAYTLTIYGLGALALLRPGTFLPTPAAALASVAAPLDRYRRSALTQADVQRLLTKLDGVMRRDRLWQDPALTLGRLAQAIGTSPNDTSQAINQGSGGSFFDYVNRLRVEEAQALLAEPGERTILDIAMAVGFNSKSAFNTAFKARTGMTPSAWRAAARQGAGEVGPAGDMGSPTPRVGIDAEN